MDTDARFSSTQSPRRSPLRRLPGWFCILVLLLGLLPCGIVPSRAQAVEISWGAPFNISNSPERTSTDAFLLGDPSGGAHLFWAEKTGDAPGNMADTLMYTYWDGQRWIPPVDIFITPADLGNQVLIFPHAVMDEDGWIHLIWMEEPNFPNYTLYYSSVYAPLARYPGFWKPPTALAEDLTGTEYSIHIAYEAPEMLHVIYARVPQGDTPPEERGVGYLHSADGGVTWSEPVDLYTTPDPRRGASNARLLVVPPGKVFASWTEWDESGNGAAIYLTRSENSGQSWSKPIRLATRIDDEYERDWNNLVHLEGDRIMAMWEGGWRAYRNAMYSKDGGKTWSDPIDTFPWLIGENGFAEFARDSLGRLYVFLAQRVREDDLYRQKVEGMWHSVWEGGSRWSEPVLAGGFNYMVNPKVVITGGNRVVAVWYTPPIFEINVMTGAIMDAPSIPGKPWPSPTPAVLPTATGIPETQSAVATLTPAKEPELNLSNPGRPLSPSLDLFLAIVPSVLVIVGLILVKKFVRGG